MPMEPILAAWPNCQTADCEHKASARRNSVYCDPCTNARNGDDSAPKGYFAEFRRVQRKEHLIEKIYTS